MVHVCNTCGSSGNCEDEKESINRGATVEGCGDWTEIVQICCICGESVAGGSGKFVNRVPDCNDLRTRIENGHRFPLGDFVCAECDEMDPEEAIEQGGNVYDVDLCSFHVQADSEEEAREKAIRYIVSEYTPVIDAIYICESDCPVRSG